MNEKLLNVYCRMGGLIATLRQRVAEAVWPPEERWEDGQAGLSKLAITVILVAVGVGLTLVVVGILGPAIVELAENTGGQIRDVPMDFGP